MKRNIIFSLITKKGNRIARHIILKLVSFPLLDFLDALEKNNRRLVLDLLCVTNIDFVEPIDKHGNTFLHRAAQCIHGRICEMVIDHSMHKIDVNRKNIHGFTPLHIAAILNREACGVLLRKGADVNITTNAGFTPLQKAAMYGCHKACRQLCIIKITTVKGRKTYDMNEKINVNWQNNAKETALHLVIAARDQAIMKSTKIWPFKRYNDRYTKIVKLLLRMGANVNLQDDDGETPIQIAVRYEMDYIVKLLLHHNADILIRSKYNKVALDLTKCNLYKHVEAMIKENQRTSESKC